MIGLLISLLIFAVVVYILFLALGMLPIPEPIKTIILLIVALIVLLWLVSFVGGVPALGVPHYRY